MEMVHFSPAPWFSTVPDRRQRGNCTYAVRSAGMRKRTRRGISDGIQLDEIRTVLSRRVRPFAIPEQFGDDSIPGRVARAHITADCLVSLEDILLRILVCLDSRNVS